MDKMVVVFLCDKSAPQASLQQQQTKTFYIISESSKARNPEEIWHTSLIAANKSQIHSMPTRKQIPNNWRKSCFWTLFTQLITQLQEHENTEVDVFNKVLKNIKIWW